MQGLTMRSPVPCEMEFSEPRLGGALAPFDLSKPQGCHSAPVGQVSLKLPHTQEKRRSSCSNFKTYESGQELPRFFLKEFTRASSIPNHLLQHSPLHFIIISTFRPEDLWVFGLIDVSLSEKNKC